MSARSAGRIAALVTARRLGVRVEAVAESDPSDVERALGFSQPPETAGAAKPAATSVIPPVEPSARVSSGEVSALQGLVSYIPSEAFTIYLAGIAAVNLVQQPAVSGEHVAAVWVLFVVSAIANGAFVWLAFRDKFREFSQRELTVRQTRPLFAALFITELALLVYAIAVPTGIAIIGSQWVPLMLLFGTAAVVASARLFGLGPLHDSDRMF